MALLLRHLDRSRFAPELYLLRRSGPHLQSIPEDIHIYGFDDQPKQFRLNWPGRIRRQQIQHLRGLIQQRDYDLVFDRALHMTQITGPATTGLNVARISTVVASPADDFNFYEHRFRWIKKRLLAKAYRESDCVLTVSQAIAQEMQQYYHVPQEKIRVLYSAIDQDEILALAKKSIPDSGDLDNAELRVLSIGRLTEVKRPQDIYQAAKILIQNQHRHIQVDFVGEGPLEAKLKAQVEQDGLSRNIRFHGFKANPFPYYCRADLLCLASTCEGLPNVIMEAMLLGVPVLAADCSSGPRELLGNQSYGTLVSVRNPLALANAMLDRINHPDRWLEKARLAQDIARQRHQLSVWQKRIEELFQNTIEQRKSR